MSQSLLVLLCAGAGLAGGFGGALLMGDVPAPETAVPADSSSSENVLERRVLELEDSIQGLYAALSALQEEVRTRRVEIPVAAQTPAQGEELLLASDGSLSDVAAPQFDALVEARVDAVLEAREEEERQAREAREAQMREEWMARRVERLATELSLSQFQKSEMDRILRDVETQRQSYFQELRQSGGDINRDQISETMRVLRENTESQLGGVLTPDQLQRYKELSPQQSFGGWGGPPSRGRGEPGNG